MLSLHVLATVVALFLVYKADKQALAWIRGRVVTLPEARMHRLHVLTWTALIVLMWSGSIMAYPMIGYLLHQPLFVIKLLFVGVLVTNALLISRLMHVAHTRPFAELSWNERMPLFLSGAISSLAWGASVVLALVVFG